MPGVDLAGTCTGPGPCVTTPLGPSQKPWIAKVGGLPLYIRAIAQALRRNGHDESSAIATAVATVKRWAAGGGNVSAETRARAAAAAAEWESKKAASHSLTAEPTPAVELAVPVATSSDGPSITVSAHMAALRKLAAAHKRAGPSQRPKIRKAMGAHAKAIQAGRCADMAAEPSPSIDLAWDEAKHPRVGGKFAPKGTQTQGAKPATQPTTAQLSPEMAAQIRDFQKRMGLPVTGSIDGRTQAALKGAVAAKGGGGGKGGGKSKAGGAAAKAAKAVAAAQKKAAALTARKAKAATAAKTKAQRATAAIQAKAQRVAATKATATVGAVNKLTATQRALYRQRVPTPPAGYAWTSAGTLAPIRNVTAAAGVAAALKSRKVSA